MRTTNQSMSAVAAVLACAAMALPARADVVNGGFESGTLSGWTQTGDTSFSGVDPFAARSGSFGAFFGPTTTGGISQSFATLANTVYTVGFSLAMADVGTPNSFSWTWNGVTQSPSFTNSGAFGYTNFSMNVLASGTTSAIGFAFTNPQSFWLLDNVSVAAIPEPPETALLLAGIVFVAARLQRRAKQGRAARLA
jgi:hypothetical protein